MSWAPGAGTTLGLASGLIIGDRPEAIPRKMQMLVQDDERVYVSRASFVVATGASATAIDSEFDRLDAVLDMTPGHPYLTQRITVENLSLDLRWSGEATEAVPASIAGIIARAGDRIRVIRNRYTYAAIALFGYGVGVYDVNAIESNDFKPRPSGYRTIREMVRMTKGSLRADDTFSSNPCSLPGLDTWAIPGLTFTPEVAILTRPGSSTLNAYALDPARGVLDLSIVPPPDSLRADLPPDLYECDRASTVLSFEPLIRRPAGRTITIIRGW